MKSKTLQINCVHEFGPGRPSGRTAQLATEFGLTLGETKCVVVASATITLGPGCLVAIVGPSGSGKSSILAGVEQEFAAACSVQHVTFPCGDAVIDRIAPSASLDEATAILTRCGLGDASLWVRPFERLSDGERFRARLARAIALHGRRAGSVPLLCDEFGSLLHRRAAKAISFGLRKLVTQYKLSVVVASSNDDILPDLQPDQIVRLQGFGPSRVESRKVKPSQRISLRRRLQITRGSKRDYDAFAPMHYRTTDELGFVDKVFVMREGSRGDVLGIVVYAHPALELALRNRATQGRFSRNPTRLNRELRVLRRLVIHPDVRGCGLGHFLVRKTLPMVGTRWVECLAVMGAFNPVFEKAGMTRIGRYDIPTRTQAALDQMRSMGVDPNARDFETQVSRRRVVREIVSTVVNAWYTATTAGGKGRVQRQTPSRLAQTFRSLIGCRPVYYIWKKGGIT